MMLIYNYRSSWLLTHFVCLTATRLSASRHQSLVRSLNGKLKTLGRY